MAKAKLMARVRVNGPKDHRVVAYIIHEEGTPMPTEVSNRVIYHYLTHIEAATFQAAKDILLDHIENVCDFAYVKDFGVGD